MWGLTCQYQCVEGPESSVMYASFPYVYDVPSAATMLPWAQWPGVAGLLTMFTTPDSGISPLALDVQQIPWALNRQNGNVYSWQFGQWVSVPTPEPAAWITDGGVMGYTGALYVCNTDRCNAGVPAGPEDWQYLIPPYTTNGNNVYLKEIAMGGWVSQAIVGAALPE